MKFHPRSSRCLPLRTFSARRSPAAAASWPVPGGARTWGSRLVMLLALAVLWLLSLFAGAACADEFPILNPPELDARPVQSLLENNREVEDRRWIEGRWDVVGAGPHVQVGPPVRWQGLESVAQADGEQNSTRSPVLVAERDEVEGPVRVTLTDMDNVDDSVDDNVDAQPETARPEEVLTVEEEAGSADYAAPSQQSVAREENSVTPEETADGALEASEPTESDVDKEASSAEPADAEAPAPVLTREQLFLKGQLEQCLAFYYTKPLNTGDDSAWSVMHSFLGLGVHTPLAVGSERGPQVNAIGWMCWNRPCGGRRLMDLRDGLIIAREGPGYQGHAGQFLAMLAQCRVGTSYEIRIDEQRFMVQDLIEAEKLTCEPGTELTFKLIALSHYLDSDTQWNDRRGRTWSIPRLIQEEIAQPINGAACGGTHRLMGLSCAVLDRHREQQPLDGQWGRAAQYIRDYHNYTFSLQNRDGSFSSDWFRRRGSWGDQDRKIQTTGHIVEWLTYSLPERELSDPRLVSAVRFLCQLMISNRHYDWEVGPRGHALRALRLYHERVLGGTATDWLPQQSLQRATARASR